MFGFLRQPYPPLHASLSRQLLTAVLLGGFVAIFLIVFKPFGTDQADIDNLDLFLAGYGLVAAATTLVPLLFVKYLVPRWLEEANWTVGKHLLYLFVTVWLGVTGAYFYLLSAGGSPDWTEYRYFAGNALLVASFPIVIITLLDYIRKLRQYEAGAGRINTELERTAPAPPPRTEPAVPAPPKPSLPLPSEVPAPNAPPRNTTVVLRDARNNNELHIDTDRLWCLHSDGNYVEVWTTGPEGGEHERQLVRNTLSQLVKQLPEGEFMTCHRSWVVHPELVERVSGNAQGYRLHRVGAPTVIVARGRSAEVLARLQARNSSPVVHDSGK